MKKDFLLSIYFFVLFIYTAVPSYIFTISEQGGLAWAMIPALFSAIVVVVYRIKLEAIRFFVPLMVLIVWTFSLYLFKGVSPSPYPFLVFVTAYVAIMTFKESIVDRYIRTVLWMAIIGLIIWLTSFIFRENLLNLADLIGMPSYSNGCRPILFWVISDGGIRNSGFCWEPGRYACLLLIALTLYTLKYGFKLNSRIIFIIFLIITTLSTTGYLVFFLFLTVLLIYKKRINPLVILPIAVIFYFVWQLPFMQEKIFSLWATENSMQSSISMLEYESTQGDDKFYVPQRFEGFMYQIMNLQHTNLFIGDGHNFLNFYVNREFGFKVVVSEGILGVLIEYGLLIGLWCYWYLYKSSSYLACYMGSKYTILFLVVFIACNFSYNFWESPLFAAIWMMAFVLNKKTVQIRK